MTRLVARLAILLLPARFRQAYGREVLGFVEQQRTEFGYRGWLGAVRLCRDTAWDLGATALRLRREQRHARRLIRNTSPHVHAFPSRSRRQVDIMLQDLRQAFRLFVHRPGVAWPAVLTLALGIGGAGLVGGLIDGLVVRPFAYPEPDRLVSIGVTFPRVSDRQRFIEAISPLEAADIASLRSLENVVWFDLGNRNISGGDVPERVFTALVLGDPFPTLGMTPVVGRGFTREELAPGGPPAAVISHRTWHGRFGGDPAIVGRAIGVNGEPTVVVGVMPAGLLLIGADLWLPLAARPSDWPRTARQFTVLARLRPGATRAEADAELSTLAAHTASDYGSEFREYAGWRLTAVPWAEVLTESLRPAAKLLAAAMAFMLLFVFANVSSLQVTRLSTRQRELAVRMALGASRWRVTRELLTESLVLALVGCALGLAVAASGLAASTALLPDRIAALGIAATFSVRVLAAGIAVSILSAVAIAVLPAMLIGRMRSADSLKSDSRGTTAGRRPHRMRQALVVVEVAVALVLLVGAGLMAHTLRELQRLDPGVNTANVLTMRLTLPAQKYRDEAITHFFTDLVSRLKATPGVIGAAAASQFPPSVFSSSRFRIAGRQQLPDSLPNADLTIVTPGTFDVLGIPLRAGRSLAGTDRAGGPPVVVVNESFAKRYFPSEAAVGQRIATGNENEARWWEIVGVVGDTRGRGMASGPEPEIYMTLEQDPDRWNQLFLLVRTAGNPSLMLPTARRLIAGIDREQPVYAIRTLEDAFAATTVQHRLSTILLAVFAGLAVVLAALGVYAVMAQSVAARRQEIGIRMALGAASGDVVRMITGQALRLLLIGAGLGLAGGVALGRVASSLLVGTSPSDPTVLGVVTAVLVATGLAAGWVPARRASRIDPASALRTE
jgi:putative ABC transport system permease protein